MPSLTFVLPHWLYWLGLILFPVIAIFLVGRRGRASETPGVSAGIAYMLLISGGFIGLHRFYLRSAWGLIFIPLFLVILLANMQDRDARNIISSARNDVTVAEFKVERYAKAAEAAPSEALTRRIETSRQDLVAARQAFAQGEADYRWWHNVALISGVLILLLVALDAVLLPGMVRRCAAREPPAQDYASDREMYEGGEPRIPGVDMPSPFADRVDRLSTIIGEFVAWWAVLAVFAYYYEVIARYVFNSPTNWVHESMFLMFGMQYLLSGAFALREGSHVRVDVLYNYLPLRSRAVMDVVTSVFFFIFTGTLLCTGWIFFHDAFEVREVSFTEWGIQYWPVKFALPLGAALILLQGLADLIRNIALLRRGEA
ncbi:TRAP transporter small permease subunit [Salinisphaera aquimarina]|uniref:TRAP transporter small permease protein n=1 Tax=Salinisphaera aquimarina TaxID=2094031 RepID=A0ABV7ENL1_9GAMM